MKYFIRNDIDSQMEHIKEKLGKIHPSHWKCSLHSTQSEDKDNNEDIPGVVTTCFLSLESPSDFVSTSLDAEKTKEYICEVYNFYQSISNILKSYTIYNLNII